MAFLFQLRIFNLDNEPSSGMVALVNNWHGFVSSFLFGFENSIS